MPNDLASSARRRAHVLHHLVALGGQHAADGALGDLFVEGGVHDRAQPRLEVADVDAVVADELARIGDAPLDQPVDDQALLLGREDRPGLRAVQGLDAAVEEHHVLERRRQLELQPGLLDDFLDLAQRVDHGDLALVDDEQRRGQQHQRQQRRRRRSDRCDSCSISGAQRLSRSRLREPSRERMSTLPARGRRLGARRCRRRQSAGAVAAAPCCSSLSSGR